jgi:3-hydroxymyristoyl/3-hydroxydecanoyl-(acyl carrier protein) dehydratase
VISVQYPKDLINYTDHPFTSETGITITRALVDQFLEISQDKPDIHTRQHDPIVPGNLLLSLIPTLLQQCIHVQSFQHCMTIGYTSIKFRTPVTVGQELYLTGTITKVRTRHRRIIVQTHCFLKTNRGTAVECVVKDLYE